MIANQTVISRYAAALFAAASDRDELDGVKADLALVAALAMENLAFAAALANNAISAAAKQTLFDHLFAQRLSPLARNFMQLLVRKRREGMLPEICREYARLADEARGIVDASVRSAVPLPGEILTALNGRLKDLLQRDVRLHVSTDPELIGGIVVRIDDQELDGSVRTRLDRMRVRLAGDLGTLRR